MPSLSHALGHGRAKDPYDTRPPLGHCLGDVLMRYVRRPHRLPDVSSEYVRADRGYQIWIQLAELVGFIVLIVAALMAAGLRIEI